MAQASTAMTNNVRHLFNHAAFEPEVVAIIAKAYDRTSAQLPDADPEVIGRIIITAATAGERDPARLSQIAIRSLRDQNSRSPRKPS